LSRLFTEVNFSKKVYLLDLSFALNMQKNLKNKIDQYLLNLNT